MSTVVAQTLSNGTVSTSTANCIQGSARAWVNYNGITQTILGSYNVSSVTYVSAGNYRINFTTALPNANASACVSPMTDNTTYTRIGSLSGATPITTTYVDVFFYEYNNRAAGNVHAACVSVFSS
jgi:hypothetical protein